MASFVEVDPTDADSTHLADYSYLGLGTFVELDYTQPDIRWTLLGTAGGTDPDTGDIYRGFDRFTRVKDNLWHNYNSSSDVDRIKYGYDRNGSRRYRENTVATSYNKSFDELYGYDLIDRLKTMSRGDLDNLKSQILNPQFRQCWTLDATGNWRKFLEDSNGDGSWSLDQTRTANKVNEITDFAESIGPSWVTPAYSRAGNMTTIPKPADPTAAYTGSYDAWNRLVRVEEGANKVAECEYDGAKRRTVKKTYVSGVLDETRHFYYTTTWRAIEERLGISASANQQVIWGERYLDDQILRDRDLANAGSMDERLYSLQDGNWNVSAITSSSGTVCERYSYDPYGDCRVLTPSFVPLSDSAYSWQVLLCGYRFDEESHLYLVRNRVLCALRGWLQRDPLGYGDGPNLYQYARGNPVLWSDPAGLLLLVPAAPPVIGGIAGQIGQLLGLLQAGGAAAQAALASLTSLLASIPGLGWIAIGVGAAALTCILIGLRRCTSKWAQCIGLNGAHRAALCTQTACPWGFSSLQDALKCGDRYVLKFQADCWWRWLGCVFTCSLGFGPQTLTCGANLCSDLCCSQDAPGTSY